MKEPAGFVGSLDVMLLTPIMPFWTAQPTNGDSKEPDSTGVEHKKPLNLPIFPGLNFSPMSVFYKEI